MVRRTVLKGLGGGVAVIGGAATVTTLRSTQEPGPVTDVEFFNEEASGLREFGPNVEQVDERAVTISGRMMVGDSTNEADIDTVTYDSDSDALRFVVGTRRGWRGYLIRNHGIKQNVYEARITFESLPQQITAVQINPLDEESTTTFEP